MEVRLLYDSMGCRKMKRSDWKRIRSKGIQVGEFFPAVLVRLQLRMNYRNHRKIVIIDGRQLSSAVLISELTPDWMKNSVTGAIRILESADQPYFPFISVLFWTGIIRQSRISLFRTGISMLRRKSRDEAVQIITSGPDSKWQNIRNVYLKMISKAKKNIYIQTPYFIPDEAVLMPSVLLPCPAWM